MFCSKLLQRLQIEVGRHATTRYADSVVVGGIYSVLKSKAPVTTAEYGDRYTLIGPLNRASVWEPLTHLYYSLLG